MHVQIFNCNSKHGVYKPYHFFMERKEKMIYVRFPLKVVSVCSERKTGFDGKNNHKQGNLAHFWLDITSKINCKTLVVMSYILSGLGSKKIQMIQRDFK